MPDLHLSADGQETECGKSFRTSGGLRSTPHPDNLPAYRDAPCRECFEIRQLRGVPVLLSPTTRAAAT